MRSTIFLCSYPLPLLSYLERELFSCNLSWGEFYYVKVIVSWFFKHLIKTRWLIIFSKIRKPQIISTAGCLKMSYLRGTSSSGKDACYSFFHTGCIMLLKTKCFIILKIRFFHQMHRKVKFLMSKLHFENKSLIEFSWQTFFNALWCCRLWINHELNSHIRFKSTQTNFD